MLKFKGIHLNKVLDCQGKRFKDLPMMLNDHMDKKNEQSVLCNRKVLGYCPVGTCDFHRVAGREYQKYFVNKLCKIITSRVKMILEKGELPGGTGRNGSRFGDGGRC